MEIDKKLYIEINEYCKLNNLKTRDFIHKILKEGFMKEKYGDSPFIKLQMTKSAEQEACEKIKDLIENQVSAPPEIMEIVDEHFFEMLDGPKKDVETTNSSKTTPVQPTTEVITNEPSKPKKKRKLN